MSEFSGRIGHLDNLESPWGNAGGVVKTVEDVERMALTGVGWIEAGSYTLEPRPGNGPNGERVYYHNPETGETFNSLGMPNKGMDVVETEIPEMARIAHAHNKALVVNVAPVTNEPVMESQELVSRAYEAGADAVLLNAGCPNVVIPGGDRHEVLSHNPLAFGKVINGLRWITEHYKPIFVRISPVESYRDMFHLRQELIGFDHYDTWGRNDLVSALFTPNTWGGNKPLDSNGNDILDVPGGVGGKSGSAMAEAAIVQTKWAVGQLEGWGIDVISSSGIMTAAELQKRLDLGAVAAAGTTFYFEPQNGWQDDTNKLLSDLADQR